MIEDTVPFDPAEAPPLLNSQKSPTAGGQLRVFSAADFAGHQAPARQFHVDPLVPGRTVTMLGGDGGTGKSLLALQLAVATVTDGKWCGLDVTQGPVLYLSGEDDEDELHRRLEDITKHDNNDLEGLGQLMIIPLAGEDALMVGSDGHSNVLKRTTLFAKVESAIAQHAPALVIIDTLADVYGGAENERAQARQFIGMLRAWAIRYKCAVLLLAHPSLAGMSSGTGLSGSTAWNNSVRSRLYLDRVKSEDNFGADPDTRVLRTVKTNYGRSGGEIRMRWQEGVFVTLEDPALVTAFGAIAAQGGADRVFLELLAAFGAEGRHVSANPSPSYAPAMFARDPRAEGINRRGFRDAMSRLFAARRIKVEMTGPPSRPRSRLVVVPGLEDH
ncbi:MAG: ATPase [Devosia sp.]|uniref:AAA family ATPase n=1 Tax=Devosia sp. TaxID=1871048 RepID=UPI0026397E79|nr:AAA family ATPase [Devosia sp.]MDB5541653.1 ATPase [Devosia sp.]